MVHLQRSQSNRRFLNFSAKFLATKWKFDNIAKVRPVAQHTIQTVKM